MDAYRSAFTAIAWSKGWPGAKIGRYLGISRARVGQKISRFRRYLADGKKMPVLQSCLDARDDEAERNGTSASGRMFVADSADWTSIEYARSMIDIVVS